ncbi:hypothetical protein QVD17_05540 [Tagetes erecta]|uniref:C2H2-type domain-containing protein n=1 Tax=Tagetes erecta TaxID=13708 RepID=A0AAD8LLQ0_TARER|nr:hypothetical protein QVD17_05540 [Tagetes erecta]
MFNISYKPGHVSTTYDTPTPTPTPFFTVPVNGQWFICPEVFTSHISRRSSPNILTQPNTSIADPRVDLELRLGQPDTSVQEEREPEMVSGTNQTPKVPDNLTLTLGYNKTVMKGRLPTIEGVIPGIRFDQAGSKEKLPKQRDYYGPCVKCGRVFDTSQSYAGHMAGHYKMEETLEERKKRLANKRKYKTPN